MVPAAAPAKTGRGIVIGSLVTLLLLLIVSGSWALLHFRALQADPRQQAIRFFDALKAQDWKTVYALSEGAERNFTSEAAYARRMQEIIRDPQAGVFFTGLLGKTPTAVGDPAIHGNEATVPVNWTRTVAMQIDGREYYQSATNSYAMRMKKIRGIWKVADDPQGIGGLVALNYHFESAAKSLDEATQATRQSQGETPKSGTVASGQNGLTPPVTSDSGLPSRADTGQAPSSADATSTNAAGSQAPPPLEDRTRLVGPADNSGANTTGVGSGYGSMPGEYGSMPGTTDNTAGAGAAPVQQNNGAGAKGNGSSPSSAPNTGDKGADDQSPPSDDDNADDNG